MTARRMACRAAVTVVGALGLLAATAGGAQAATRYVAANGIDLGNCGTLTLPCRSITQGIAVANAGDRILVGPGRYGDLNRNGTFGEPNEEPSEQNTGCQCMIHVTKRVSLESTAGAVATIIDATGAQAAIRIGASDVVIGRRNRGFTVTGGTDGLILQNLARAHIEDNVFTGNLFSAISMNGDGHMVTGNAAINNTGNGFIIGGVASTDNTVMANVATGNGQAGFSLRGDRMRTTGNVAGDNGGAGFSVFYDHSPNNVFTGNVSAGNRDKGFILGTGAGVVGAVVRRNAAVGNLRGGIFMAGNGVQVTQSNIFGNGILPDVAQPGGLLNCGVISGLSVNVVADNNFWGFAGGPDADPGDQACAKGTGTIDTTPFATRPFTIVPGAGL